MSLFELVMWGVAAIGITGFTCCMVSLVLDIKLWNLKQRLWTEEYNLRVRAQAASLIDFTKLKRE